MYRRMYGTHHPTPTHGLMPIAHEPWLQAKSRTSTVKWVLCGTGGVILATVMLFAWARVGLVPSNATVPNVLAGMLLLLSCLGVVLSLVFLLILWVEWSCRDAYQYCPECLSYMARGAKVCPFCGFRPEGPTASPQRPLQRSQTHH